MSITRADCVSALRETGLSQLDAEQTVDQMIKRKNRLDADGRLVRGDADLAAATTAEFDAAKTMAANKRRQSAMTIMRRMENDERVARIKDAGFTFMDGMESIFVGSSKRGIPGGRRSIDATRQSIEAKMVGSFLNELEMIGRQHGGDYRMMLSLMARDESFTLAFVQERMQPGSVRDPKVKAVVDLYDRSSEYMRLRLNQNGAFIGKLEGRLPQLHDEYKLMDASLGGKQGWLEYVEGRLDTERSFPDRSPGEVREILGDIYDTIATGQDTHLPTARNQQHTTPHNIATSLGQHRVLHFKDAKSFTEYQQRYGKGNLYDSIFGEFSANSRTLALMEVLGPNPEAMVRSMLDNEKVSIRAQVAAGTLDTNKADKQLRRLDSAFASGIMPTGEIARWMSVLTGETQRPINVGLAKVGGILRSIQSLAKLGAAALSTVADGFTKSMVMRSDGFNFLERTTAPFLDYFKSYKGDKRILARELGFLLNDMHGTLLHRFDMAENTPGRISSAMNLFFKYTGMTWATEQQKAGFAQRLSNLLGRTANGSLDKLDPAIRAMLQNHGFDAGRWDLFRTYMMEGSGQERYFNPALARNIPDAAITNMLPEHLQGETPSAGYAIDTWNYARQRELDRIRTNIETEARAFFVDETKSAVIEPDAKTTATMTRGTRPGTKEGEALRAIMQFKSFPIAFYQRILAGKRWQRGGTEGFDVPGAIEFTMSSLAYGYTAMTLKDLSKNRTPRDPRKWETWMAAAAQGGGAGIYGDFFFSKANRFGSDFVETLAGPLMGEVGGLVKTGNLALHGEPGAASDQLIRTAMGNTPFINAWFAKAALDWMFLDRIKEEMSPGYKRRMQRNMQKEFGQNPLF